MSNTGESGRRRLVRFERPLTAEDKESISNRLLNAEVSEVEFSGDNCSIHYPFPELSLDMIFDLLSSPVHGPLVKPVKHFSDAVIIFMENNERSHITHAGGWKHNVEDSYIHYFDHYSFERQDMRRQSWRNYKET